MKVIINGQEVSKSVLDGIGFTIQDVVGHGRLVGSEIQNLHLSAEAVMDMKWQTAQKFKIRTSDPTDDEYKDWAMFDANLKSFFADQKRIDEIRSQLTCESLGAPYEYDWVD
jgi:hypothetical protein